VLPFVGTALEKQNGTQVRLTVDSKFTKTHFNQLFAATLITELGGDGKLVADELGHSLDVSQNVYTQSPVERKLPAANQVEKSLLVM
jgi:hypothetical protein